MSDTTIDLYHSFTPSYYFKKARDKGVDPHDVMRVANKYVGHIEALGLDTDWIHNGDAIDMVAVRRNGIDFDRYSGEGNGTIAMPNEAYAVIWLYEILGQISDGAWENYWVDEETPGLPGEWQDYFDMDVVIDEDLDAPELRDDARLPVKLQYREEMTRYEAGVGRMIFMARCSGADEEFDADDVNQMLLELQQMGTRARTVA